MEGRRENQEYLHCGSDDHFVRDCRYGPAKQPVPEHNEPSRNKSAASTTRTSEDTPSTTRSTPGKAKKKKKAPALVQVEEVEGSE